MMMLSLGFIRWWQRRGGVMETLKIIVAFVAFLLTSIPALTHAQNDEAQWRKFALDAMSKGHIRDALRKLEAEAAADDKANRWNQAASLYRLASGMARRSGELQKSLTLAYKAVECAEKSQEPMLRSGAIMSVVDILRGLGKSSDAKTWILKGLENVKTIPPGVNRDGSSATFNNYMGQDALRSGQVQEAIDYFLHAIRDRESVIATNQRGRASRLIPQNMDMLVWHLQGLGSAYQKASRSAEAIKTYERALQIIEEFGLQESRAVDTYEGLARLYLDQKESDRAEQYFLKAYQYTEKRQLFVGFVSSAVQLGHLAIQRNQPSEAFDYYKNAIAKIEASRSQIQSEENRKSFLANQIAAYSGIVRASVATNKSEEAFD
jgi:tetratricopeptide (TPR) repeat protein